MERGLGYYFLQLIHWVIIINFAIEIAYANYIIFGVFSPPEAGHSFDRAKSFPVK